MADDRATNFACPVVPGGRAQAKGALALAPSLKFSASATSALDDRCETLCSLHHGSRDRLDLHHALRTW